MLSEENRSHALRNMSEVLKLRIEVSDLKEERQKLMAQRKESRAIINAFKKKEQESQMEFEDMTCQIVYKSEKLEDLEMELYDSKEMVSELKGEGDQLKKDLDETSATLKEKAELLETLEAEAAKLKTDLEEAKDNFVTHKKICENKISDL